MAAKVMQRSSEMRRASMRARGRRTLSGTAIRRFPDEDSRRRAPRRCGEATAPSDRVKATPPKQSVQRHTRRSVQPRVSSGSATTFAWPVRCDAPCSLRAMHCSSAALAPRSRRALANRVARVRCCVRIRAQWICSKVQTTYVERASKTTHVAEPHRCITSATPIRRGCASARRSAGEAGHRSSPRIHGSENEKTQRSAGSLVVLVGVVGIEPTTFTV